MTPLSDYLAERDRVASDGWYEGAEDELARLLSGAVATLAGDVPRGLAVVATGGFGRSVMAVQSDVDLLFLHSGQGEAELARRVLRPLWDAHLKVGHLSHTPKDARVFAGTRLDAISTFLTARLITGDAAVFEEFRKRFLKLLEKEHARIIRMMADEERRRRDEEPYRLMACDLKVGRGGIRTLDMLDWRRRLIEAHGASAPTPHPEEHATRVELTAVRSAIHSVTGRLHDTFDFEIRERTAEWLGIDLATLGRLVMSARSTAERLVDETWPEVVKPPSKRVTSLPEATRIEHRGDTVAWWTSGVLDPVPEVERLLDEAHRVPFHAFAVADHTLAAVDRAWEMIDGTFDDAIAREALANVTHPALLVWGALLHDIGKGLPGDHSRVGSAKVPAIAGRVGLDADDAAVLERLVAHHLLLADLATKYDHGDPAVLAWAADRIADRQTLQLLYLLTVADSRATGSDTWSPWRAELLRRAYRQMEREMSRRAMPEPDRIAVLTDQVVDVSDGALGRAEVVAHLAGLSEIYRTSHSPRVIRDHILLAQEPLGPGGGRIATYPDTPTRIVILATDRPRLLLDVAGVMALHRLSIIDARFATRADGRVFDTFEVVDGLEGGDVDSRRLSDVERDLERALRGGFDVDTPLSVKQRAYRDLGRPGFNPLVRIRRSDDGGGFVEVEAGDRLGLLHDLGVVFDRFGMPITRARVDTRGGVAYDVFQVARMPADTEPLEAALLAALG
ncbi:MAG: HD domain-containing protein [Acidimicrobiia bacterium]